MTPLHEAALRYALQGWAVFPCQPGGKAPLGGQGHLEATTDAGQINEWWTRNPNANIGGAVAPSGLVVLDVDVAEGKPGRASLAEIDHELPDTLTAITGRGGLHAVYSRPADVAARRVIGFKPGLDLIGDGYIILAPSVLAEGGQYKWNVMKPPAPLPEVLINASRAVKDKVQLTSAAVGSPIGSGGRNVALFRLGAALRDSGIGAEALARALDAENKQRCQPPLEDFELRAIVDSVLARVQPSRDVAAGAIVQQEFAEMFAPKAAAIRVGEYKPVHRIPQRFYPTVFPQLNKLTNGGLATRHHFGIIGPPSCGKSGFVNELVLEQQRHTPVLVYSAELPMDEVRVRLAARICGFPWVDGIKGRIPQDTIDNALRTLNVWIVGADEIDRANPIEQIRAEAERIKQSAGMYPAIFEDYVQLLARGHNADQVRHKVGDLALQFRILSQELDTVVAAVYSTSRAFYGNNKNLDLMRKADDPTAYLAAAKESGDIEFDCATLVYLDLDKIHEGLPKPARVAVARCRVGEVGFVGVRAQLDTGKWFDDPSALSELSADERNSKVATTRLEKDCDRLHEVVTRMEGRPWQEIKMATGMDYRRAAEARSRLVETGRLELAKEQYYDSLQRKGTREILRTRVQENVVERSE